MDIEEQHKGSQGKTGISSSSRSNHVDDDPKLKWQERDSSEVEENWR